MPLAPITEWFGINLQMKIPVNMYNNINNTYENLSKIYLIKDIKKNKGTTLFIKCLLEECANGDKTIP